MFICHRSSERACVWRVNRCVAFKGRATNQIRSFHRSGITTGIRPGMWGINQHKHWGLLGCLNTVKLKGTTIWQYKNIQYVAVWNVCKNNGWWTTKLLKILSIFEVVKTFGRFSFLKTVVQTSLCHVPIQNYQSIKIKLWCFVH